MKGSSISWMRGIGAMLVVGALVVAISGSAVAPVAAKPPESKPEQQLQEILDRLDRC